MALKKGDRVPIYNTTVGGKPVILRSFDDPNTPRPESDNQVAESKGRVIRVSDEQYDLLMKYKEVLGLNSVDETLSQFLDKAEGTLITGNGTGGGEVDEAWACPHCGERDTDNLAIDDAEHVKCGSCGQEYDLADNKVMPVVVGVPVPLCPLIDSYCRQGECAWWDGDFHRCSISGIALGMNDLSTVYCRQNGER